MEEHKKHNDHDDDLHPTIEIHYLDKLRHRNMPKPQAKGRRQKHKSAAAAAAADEIKLEDDIDDMQDNLHKHIMQKLKTPKKPKKKTVINKRADVNIDREAVLKILEKKSKHNVVSKKKIIENKNENTGADNYAENYNISSHLAVVHNKNKISAESQRKLKTKIKREDEQDDDDGYDGDDGDADDAADKNTIDAEKAVDSVDAVVAKKMAADAREESDAVADVEAAEAEETDLLEKKPKTKKEIAKEAKENAEEADAEHFKHEIENKYKVAVKNAEDATLHKFTLRTSDYYMNNRKIFIKKIAELFRPYKKEIENRDEAVSCNSMNNDELQLLTHQRVIRDYLNLYTPYRGLLLYMGLGAGKSCTSIAVAESMKSHKQIVVLTPASLKKNFFNELKKCGDILYRRNQNWEFVATDGRPHYIGVLSQVLNIPAGTVKHNRGAWLVKKGEPNFSKLTQKQQTEIDEQIDAMIRNKYIDINYNGLSHEKLQEMTDGYSVNLFSGRVVIIDEAHNLVSRIINSMKKRDSLAYKIYEMLMSAENCKLVLLSGTPIINYPNEIGVLFNILRGYIKKWIFKVDSAKLGGKLNAGVITKMFDDAGFNTYDVVEYSGNKCVITRNPFGFINVDDTTTHSGGGGYGSGRHTKKEEPHKEKSETSESHEAFHEPHTSHSASNYGIPSIPTIPQIALVGSITESITHFGGDGGDSSGGNKNSGHNHHHEGFHNSFHEFSPSHSGFGGGNEKSIKMRSHSKTKKHNKHVIAENKKHKHKTEKMIIIKSRQHSANSHKKKLSRNNIGDIGDIERLDVDTTEFEIKDGVLIQTPTHADLPIDETESVDYYNRTSDGYYADKTYGGGGASGGAGSGGVTLNETGNISDADFVLTIQNIFKKNNIRIIGEPKLEVLKALPDDAKEFNAMFVDETNVGLKNENVLKRRILGLSSYFKSASEKLMPRIVHSGDAEDADDSGSKKGTKQKIYSADFDVVRVEMSEYQFSKYEHIRKEEAKMEKNVKIQKMKKNNGAVKGALEDTVSSSYRIFSRAVCNFAFPEPPGKPFLETKKMDDEDAETIGNSSAAAAAISSKIDLAKDNDLDDDGDDDPDNVTEIAKKYKDRINAALRMLAPDKTKSLEEQYLCPDKLAMYSPKFKKILENIKDPRHHGLHLFYSQFRTLEGIGIFKLVLETNGFAEFKIRKNEDDGEWEIIEDEEDAGKQRFVLYTGTETTEEKEMILNIYNSHWTLLPPNIAKQLRKKSQNNFYGEIIKVLKITAAGAEGLNLKNTRFVHLCEPYWNNVRIQQVIGRARRICSHQELPEEDKTVQAFLYLSVFSKEQTSNKTNIDLMLRDVSRINGNPITTDESLFEIANIKDKINNEILDAIKSTAVDCSLYSKENNMVCYSFGKTDAFALSSENNIENDLGQIDDDTNIQHEVLSLTKTKPIGVDKTVYVFDKNSMIVYSLKSYENFTNGEGELEKVGKFVEKEGNHGKYKLELD